MFQPSLDEFRELASSASATGGNLVPVYRQLLADTLTPVSAFRALVSSGCTTGSTSGSSSDLTTGSSSGPATGGGPAETAFLLESVEGGEKIGRYSFLGVRPFLTFRSDLV